jgi:hypothetical protein
MNISNEFQAAFEVTNFGNIHSQSPIQSLRKNLETVQS